MPRHGQPWDFRLTTLSDEFAPFSALLAHLTPLPEFPGPQALTALVESARLARTPELRALEFVLVTPKTKRFRRPELRLQDLYDARIALEHRVPCYPESYHDLFNALMFAAFPRAKRALHQRQYRALERWVPQGARQLPGKRTREQDALTLMDEGGSVVVCRLTERDAFERGQTLDLGESTNDACLVVFGHALLEHLAEGQQDLRSSARVLWLDELPSPHDLLDSVDCFLENLLLDPTRFREPDADAVVEWRRGRAPSLHRAGGARTE